jgi:UV DNA damage repair endonuclease
MILHIYNSNRHPVSNNNCKSALLDTILSNISPVHNLIPHFHFFNIRFYITRLPFPKSNKL